MPETSSVFTQASERLKNKQTNKHLQQNTKVNAALLNFEAFMIFGNK